MTTFNKPLDIYSSDNYHRAVAALVYPSSKKALDRMYSVRFEFKY